MLFGLAITKISVIKKIMNEIRNIKFILILPKK